MYGLKNEFLSICMQRCYSRCFIHIMLPKNLSITSGLSMLMRVVISRPDATSYDQDVLQAIAK